MSSSSWLDGQTHFGIRINAPSFEPVLSFDSQFVRRALGMQPLYALQDRLGSNARWREDGKENGLRANLPPDHYAVVRWQGCLAPCQ